jgi:hypothetical protein
MLSAKLIIMCIGVHFCIDQNHLTVGWLILIAMIIDSVALLVIWATI